MLSVMLVTAPAELLRIDLALETKVLERLPDRFFAGRVDLAREEDFLLDGGHFLVNDRAQDLLREDLRGPGDHRSRSGSTNTDLAIYLKRFDLVVGSELEALEIEWRAEPRTVQLDDVHAEPEILHRYLLFIQASASCWHYSARLPTSARKSRAPFCNVVHRACDAARPCVDPRTAFRYRPALTTHSPVPVLDTASDCVTSGDP